ncbi:MAG: substrate-binding periplasmic protein [Halodesulfovibrio sp.]
MRLMVRMKFLVILVLLLRGTAWAGEIKVAYTDYAPYRMTRPDGSKYGIDIDFLNELASRLGYTVVYVDCPFERGLSSMQTGKVDIMTGMLSNPEREEYMYFVQPPYKRGAAKAFYVKADSGISIEQHEDLYGKLVGVIGGVRYYTAFDEDPRIRKERVITFSQNIKKLVNNRVDVVIQTEIVGDYILSHLPEGGQVVKAVFRNQDSQQVYLAISRKSPLFAQRDRIAEVLRDMQAEGYWETCLRRYMHVGGTPGLATVVPH